MSDEKQTPRYVGGKHGSPTITIAFPFSQVKSIDTDVRSAVAELAELVAQLAESSNPGVHKSALDLAERLNLSS